MSRLSEPAAESKTSGNAINIQLSPPSSWIPMPIYYSSEWHRWDPHIHAPGTALEDGFGGDWQTFFERIESASPAVTALGITDYLSTRTYEEFIQRRPKDHAPELVMVFPNVEFRLAPRTTKGHGINAHLLVSPESPDHVERVNDALSRLTMSAAGREVISCTRRGLITLGKMHTSKGASEEIVYRAGVEQFKIDAGDFIKWFNGEHWLRENALLGIAGGNDGLAGIRRDSGFSQYHDELVRATDLLLSPQPSDRVYYAGLSSHGDARAIEARYGSLKPCIHGSDAHDIDRVLAPDLGRYCWIKAAPTFDGLRQILFEPWERVYIGVEPPAEPDPDQVIDSIAIRNHDGWFANEDVALASSLVAIIGEKGSGKTALADLIAAAADAWDETEASFLSKSADHLAGCEVELRWKSGRASLVQLPVDPAWTGKPQVRYLSQQFVERLCSADLLADELVKEVERVVFEHIPPQDRLNSTDFDDLVRKKTEEMAAERAEIRQALAEANDVIDKANAQRAGIQKKVAETKSLDKEILRLEGHLKTLLTAKEVGAAERIKALRDKRDLLTTSAAKIQERIAKTENLYARVLRTEARFTEWYEDLRGELLLAGVPRDNWAEFKPVFAGKPLDPLKAHRDSLEHQHRAIVGGPNDPEGSETLARISAQLEGEEKKLELDDTRRRQVKKHQNALAEAQAKKAQLQSDIDEAQRWEREERPRVRERRDALYARYFELLDEEKHALAALYEPLKADLARRPTGERDLDFEVITTVDVDAWAAVGEDMLDLRKSGRYTQRGALERDAHALLERAWLTGDTAAIKEGIRHIGEAIVEGTAWKRMLRQGYTVKHVADWLYSVDHIQLEYGLKYRGVPLRFLSPGTRGIVLLILYLAVDTADDRPLLVDQPEENLDNASVFSVLVQYFRDAKKRRQIILVTHNPNLVVNTDAEQVIVATAARRDSGLPTIGYSYGPLELVRRTAGESPIKEKVCEILEGGRHAFRNRERRYN